MYFLHDTKIFLTEKGEIGGQGTMYMYVTIQSKMVFLAKCKFNQFPFLNHFKYANAEKLVASFLYQNIANDGFTNIIRSVPKIQGS